MKYTITAKWMVIHTYMYTTKFIERQNCEERIGGANAVLELSSSVVNRK